MRLSHEVSLLSDGITLCEKPTVFFNYMGIVLALDGRGGDGNCTSAAAAAAVRVTSSSSVVRRTWAFIIP